MQFGNLQTEIVNQQSQIWDTIGVAMDEHRRALRVEVSIGAILHAAEGFFYAESGDLSETGLLLHAKKPFPIGTHLQLTFGLPPNLPRIEAEAVVKRWQEGEGVGVEFISLKPEDKARISNFLKTGVENQPRGRGGGDEL